jgi:hypothetical protein
MRLLQNEQRIAHRTGHTGANRTDPREAKKKPGAPTPDHSRFAEVLIVFRMKSGPSPN